MTKEEYKNWRVTVDEKKGQLERFIEDLRVNDPDEWHKLCRAESDIYHSYLKERIKKQFSTPC